jgi:hypothetical protein
MTCNYRLCMHIDIIDQWHFNSIFSAEMEKRLDDFDFLVNDFLSTANFIWYDMKKIKNFLWNATQWKLFFNYM